MVIRVKDIRGYLCENIWSLVLRRKRVRGAKKKNGK